MKNKVIVVTGASSGIGYEIASALHSKGHTVIGCSRTFPNLSYQWIHKICDLSKEASIVEFSKTLPLDITHLDALINCAGSGIAGALEDTSYHVALKHHQVNVLGPFLMIQLLLPYLRKSHDAKIINIGSVAGDITIPFQAFYSMSKSALARMSEALRYELKPFNIDVSIVLPGDTKTAFTQHRITDNPPQSLYKARVMRSINKMSADEERGKSPKTVVKAVLKQLKRKRMKPVLTVGFTYKIFICLNKFLPKKLIETMIYKRYGK